MLFKSLLQNEITGTTDLTNPQPWFLSLFGTNTASGEVITPSSSLMVSAVFASVNILGNSVAKLPLHTFRKTASGRERDSSHKVSKLLEKRPNPYQTPFKFKHTAEVHRNLWGNAYINIEWDWDGRPKNLWLLNPAATDPKLDENGKLWYWTRLPNGTLAKLEDTDVIHLTTLSLDGLKGKSMIQIAREQIGSSQAAQKFKGKFFTNGAAPTGVLKVPGQVNPDAKKVIRDEWEKANAGINNAQRVAILDNGLEFQSIGMPLRDAQFIEGMKFDKNEIAAIFNIPPHMLNELGDATFSNVEQLSLNFIGNTMDPILTQYEEEFSFKLFSESEQKRYYLKFNLAKLMRTDHKTRMEFYKGMTDIGAFSINKVLELEDLNGIGEAGDKHRVDLNHISVEIADEYQLAKAKSGLKGGDNGGK